MFFDKVFTDGVDGLDEEIFFVSEMEVKSCPTQICLVGDFFNGYRFISFFQDQMDQGILEGAPGALNPTVFFKGWHCGALS